jgi:hypothetical protein
LHPGHLPGTRSPCRERSLSLNCWNRKKEGTYILQTVINQA